MAADGIAATYVSRLADARIAALMSAFPAVLLNGPRAVGKTTTARQHAATWVRLDNPGEAVAFRADPDSALRVQREPVLLDEWQEVPEVLGAVKRAVDDDPRPGRFVLTGSVRAELEQRSWPGTGRLLRLAMYGLSELELRRQVGSSSFLQRLRLAEQDAFALPPERPDLVGYLELALRGGFPDVALRDLAPPDRAGWLDSYLEQLLSRDTVALAHRRHPGRMRRYFEALALSTAGLPLAKTLADAAGVDTKTGQEYDSLFERLFVTQRIPAWTPRRLSRLTHAPKRYATDPALAARAAGWSLQAVLRQGEGLGRLLETFVMAQIRAEVASTPEGYRLHHLRTQAGRREIDVIVEIEGHDIMALEVKATASPSRGDARHLEWLRDELGDRFVAGAVMHTGPHAFGLGDRILAVPLCAMWGGDGDRAATPGPR